MDNAAHNSLDESYSDIRQALAKDIEDLKDLKDSVDSNIEQSFIDIADVVTAVPNHPICCLL